MNEYFQYLGEMLKSFFTDFGIFFRKVFADPWADVPGNVNRYNSLLGEFSSKWGGWGWFFWVLFLLAFVAALGGLLFLAFLGLRKYKCFFIFF